MLAGSTHFAALHTAKSPFSGQVSSKSFGDTGGQSNRARTGAGKNHTSPFVFPAAALQTNAGVPSHPIKKNYKVTKKKEEIVLLQGRGGRVWPRGRVCCTGEGLSCWAGSPTVAAGRSGATARAAVVAASGLPLPAGGLPSVALLPSGGAWGTNRGRHPPSGSGSRGPGFGAAPREC